MNSRGLEVENIKSIIKGDEHAFKIFFDVAYPEVYRQIYRLIRDEENAIEIVQKTFIKVWEQREKIDPNQNVLAYVKRIGSHLAIDHFRSTKRYNMEELDTQYEAFELPVEVEEPYLRQCLQDSIESLPPKRRMIFRLSKEDGWSYKEISEHLDISIKTVENQMGTALKDLRKQLKPLLKHLYSIFF